MAKSVRDIAIDIDGFMKKKTLNVWTLPWDQLYVVASRERIKEAFQTDLRHALKAHALEITYGVHAVTIHRDANFGPQEYK
ncbi:hypothetical protein [Pseudomonas syringae group genomosp. 3]|uniref:hypothetical protein n=1 Tax=Pseudomonas syringae group TaxID=136849 RepID=UPI0006E6C680|nr:hypothetical protein [Pseudomonas syringae group genomosp. 3]KPW50826.1 Uncharacterized protein ALO86_01295 [Pseudomonas syringae pv. berberidis]KPY29099.1 Uncharacterized protein ALO54_02396 [Pseudomonas syringae pv. philadelphi]RMM24042.1 hypothetical protein ALQ83_01998 [Pseudomonas syringae pv. berberidis]RMP72904.1 hypothetical protein ALQ19_03682 [Pseudomonas syringae pv. berberidis]RMQ36104.1 hypothetical protein ALQ06_02806 [Pseudomonas syringae pv. berberidis]